MLGYSQSSCLQHIGKGTWCASGQHQSRNALLELAQNDRNRYLGSPLCCLSEINTARAVSSLIASHKEAITMEEAQRNSWHDFDASIELAAHAEWASMSTAPERVNGKWTSVFLLSEPTGMCITRCNHV